MNPKENLITHLKTLMLGGTVALAMTQNAQAAKLAPQDAASDIDTRVAKVRESLGRTTPGIVEGRQPAPGHADMLWWRNAWGNGGWHNWHNGWHNWHNGGWGNWHNY